MVKVKGGLWEVLYGYSLVYYMDRRTCNKYVGKVHKIGYPA